MADLGGWHRSTRTGQAEVSLSGSSRAGLRWYGCGPRSIAGARSTPPMPTEVIHGSDVSARTGHRSSATCHCPHSAGGRLRGTALARAVRGEERANAVVGVAFDLALGRRVVAAEEHR